MFALLMLLALTGPRQVDAGPALEPAGMLIADSTLPGQRRADDVVPRTYSVTWTGMTGAARTETMLV
jgi:hypothetical protein